MVNEGKTRNTSMQMICLYWYRNTGEEGEDSLTLSWHATVQSLFVISETSHHITSLQVLNIIEPCWHICLHNSNIIHTSINITHTTSVRGLHLTRSLENIFFFESHSTLKRPRVKKWSSRFICAPSWPHFDRHAGEVEFLTDIEPQQKVSLRKRWNKYEQAVCNRMEEKD